MTKRRGASGAGIKDKLAELVILLDQENAAGNANITTCVVMFDIPNTGVSVQLSGLSGDEVAKRMILALAQHTQGAEPAHREQILPPKDRRN